MRQVWLLFLLASNAPAAAPTLTHLFPAGAGRGQTVELIATGTFSRWPIQAWCSDRGVSVKPLAARGKFSVTVAADATPGISWLRLHDEEGASVLRPFVLGVLPEIVEQEPNNEIKQAMKADAVGVVVNGRLGARSDVDCFAVTLRKGQTLVADLLANRTLGSPMDAVLQIVSLDGFVLAENNDTHGLDPRVLLTAPTDGTFIVRLYAFPAVADSTIQFSGADTYIYRLTLRAGSYADHIFPLAVSRLSPGTVEVVGWNLPDALRSLKVTPGEDDTATSIEPRLVNPLTVRVEPHPCSVEKEPNDRKSPHPVTLPVSISGRIDEAGDVDVFRFPVKKAQTLQFQVESESLGFPLDPVLRLTDATGKTLLEADDAGSTRDATLAYTPSADWELRLEVRDLHGHGGPRYAYRLRLGQPTPSLTLTVAADRFTIGMGKAVDLPVTIVAANGFREELEVRAEGLPEGVRAPPVKWDPAKGGNIILKLSATKGPLSSAFRVVAQGKDRRYSARAASLPHLWLTVTR